MKVYLVVEEYGPVYAVFDSEDKAKEYLEELGYGYYLTEMEMNKVDI